MENPKSVSGGDVPSMLHSNSQESAFNVSCPLWVDFNIFLQVHDFWNCLL